MAIGVRGVQPALPKPGVELVTVREAIGNLPLEADGRKLHVGRNPTPLSVKRYRCIPPRGNRFDLMRKRPDLTPQCWLNKPTGSTDVFGRMRWDKPAPTIRTEFFKPEKGRYLHPRGTEPLPCGRRQGFRPSRTTSPSRDLELKLRGKSETPSRRSWPKPWPSPFGGSWRPPTGKPQRIAVGAGRVTAADSSLTSLRPDDA